MAPQDFRISRAAVDGLSDQEICWALIEQYWPDSEADEKSQLAAGTAGQKAIYAVTLFAREVDNGGLDQFFWNSSGDLYPEVVEGLARIGAATLAEALESAAKFFGDDQVYPDRKHRQQKLDTTPRETKRELFEPLENQFYGEKGSAEELVTPLFLRYIAHHPTEFFLD
jgi:hypothetical protein